MLYAEFITFICLQKATLTNDTKDKEYTPHDLPQRQSVQPQETCSIARRAKRMRSEVSPVCLVLNDLVSVLIYVKKIFFTFFNPHKSKHRNYKIGDVQILICTSSFCVCIVQLFTEFNENKHNILILSLLQRSFIKSEPGEICTTRNSLRRRMGTYSVKPEYGKITARKTVTFLKQVSYRSSLVVY